MSNRFATGDVIGRYRVERLLGQGAMGEVYLARDPHIDRLLAVKTLRPAGGLADEEVGDRRSRMLREARAAGRLVHPHIVTLFDAGEHDDTVFLAFEYVAGTDLGRRLATGPPPPVGEALRIAREAAEGLAAAHRQGIVHRDVKPTNLLLAEDGRVKISDFGIAKLAGEVTELTVAGTVLGSPHYLSPEQVRGEALDGRSDLFSLGVVLYEMLSGRRPFGGETLTTLVYQILSTEPAPLPLAAELAPLAGLLGRLLAKNRDHRLAGAGELAAELARLERSLPATLLGALPGDEAEATLVLPTTGALLPTLPADGPPIPPPPPAGASAQTAGGAAGWTAAGPAPGTDAHVALGTSTPWRSATGDVSAETSGRQPSGTGAPPAASQPMALPGGSVPPGTVPPASGTYSLPAARPGRAGRLMLLAAAVVLLLGVGTVLLVLLRPSLVGLGGPEQDGEVAAAGSALPGGGERLRDRREAAAGEGGRLPTPDEGGGAAGTLPVSAAAAGRQRAGGVSPDSSAPPTAAPPSSARPTAAGSSAGDPRAASQPRSGQPPPGLSQPSPVEPASPSPDPLAGRSSRSGTALPGAAADDGPVRDPALPPTAAGPSDADLADATPPQPSGPAIATGMRLAMRVVPADAFVLLDGTVVGKAAQFGARSPLLLPSPGEHRITLRRAGMADRHLRIVASESGAGVSPILATLQPLAAGETPFHELEVHRVGKAVAFRVDPPTTRVLVDGVDHGLAARYRGGRFGGGNWLELPLGLHRVSLVAPGHRRLDVVVDVTSGAEEERRVVRLRLPPLPEGAP